MISLADWLWLVDKSIFNSNNDAETKFLIFFRSDYWKNVFFCFWLIDWLMIKLCVYQISVDDPRCLRSCVKMIIIIIIKSILSIDWLISKKKNETTTICVDYWWLFFIPLTMIFEKKRNPCCHLRSKSTRWPWEYFFLFSLFFFATFFSNHYSDEIFWTTKC